MLARNETILETNRLILKVWNLADANLLNPASQNVLEKIGFTKRGVEIYNGEKTLVYFAKKSNE